MQNHCYWYCMNHWLVKNPRALIGGQIMVEILKIVPLPIYVLYRTLDFP